MKVIAAVAVAVLLIATAYLVFGRSRFESEHGSQIIQLKKEGDELATQGKTIEAFKKYEKVVLMASQQKFHTSELRNAVEEAKDARTRMWPAVQQQEQAELATHVQSR